ncbi:uncharacterized protein LOC131630774 isoform X1 [Vicia villosa]|uniref:uncharacterized protein LOC131630774 isoform X1 n=1 Tax=Vicia villosa TaxID=3911 RepID=UPI00273C60F5|nr:uncharacterized protein LOC131630774 isoform X1 [Vicia villosa]
MMNILALSLFITSLTTASIFSPNPNTNQKHHQQPNTIIKEGHRVVVVEYDQDGHQNTKISISPEQDSANIDSTFIENTKDRIKETASVLPNIGQGISQPQDSSSSSHYNLHTPNARDAKELICDAYGKCKHKISNAMGKARDKASETIDKKKELDDNVVEAFDRAKDKVYDKANEAKERVYDKANDVHEYTRDSLEKAKETGQTFKEHVVRNVTEAKDGVKKVLSLERVESVMRVANLLGFASGYGMCVWITFVSSYVLSRVMPRQQFAVVQSKIYPVYFRAMGYCLGVALLGHVFGHGMRHGKSGGVLQSWNLLGSLLAVFVNSLYLEPRATKLMFERMKMEKEEGRGREDMTTVERNRTEEHLSSPDPRRSYATTTANVVTEGTESPAQRKDHEVVRAKIMKLNNKLKKLNSYSSFLNILNLMSLTWHLVYLAQNMHQIC